MVVKRIGVLSLGRVMGTIYGTFGLIIGAILALLSLIGAGVVASEGQGGFEALLPIFFGVGAVIILPLFYGLMTFLVGMLIAVVYNLVARLVGGLELELE